MGNEGGGGEKGMLKGIKVEQSTQKSVKWTAREDGSACGTRGVECAHVPL